jgi:DNA/RNA endonuclease YhcR with UshA esterase domain
MSLCSSCGRYIGPHEACPYCGARQTGRTSLLAIKIVAILLATAGLAFLWLAATRAEVPKVAIGQVGATMNMAYVWLEGRCTRPPSYDPEGDYLSFWIEDGTGELRVVAYRAEARQIIERGHVPALGDQIKVAGTLRVREDFLSLTINVLDQLEITRAESVERDIGAIAPEDQYLRVRVRGQVRYVYEPYEGLTLVIVRDETGSIPVVVSEDLIALSGVTPILTTGHPVEIVATVSLYGDTPQLVPASTADIVPLDWDAFLAARKFISELTAAGAGQLATVRGTIIEANPFSTGVKLTLDDGTGTIFVLLWQDIYDGMPNGLDLGVGAEVQVLGEVSQDQGELKLIPELIEDVRVLAAAVPPAEVSIGELTTADVDRWVTLRGMLGQPEIFSKGVKFPLNDGSGAITLLFWQNVYERAPEGLKEGVQLVVTGQVAEYQGELELTNLNAGKMLVVGVGEAQQVGGGMTQAIGDVTLADLRQTRVLVGTLGEMETFSAGVKFPLYDDTGAITLLLWQNIYAAIPNADQLTSGARVEVVGLIDEYQGDLEIIPEVNGVRVIE